MLRSIRQHAPIVVATLIYLILVGILYQQSMRLTDGNFTYAMDDPYIHMAIAKNLAEHGVWGVTRYGFCSASSSVLWTAILATCYKIVGANEFISLVLTILSGILLLTAVDFALKTFRLCERARFGVLLGVVLFAPLPNLTLIGMEHVAHAAATIAVLCSGAILLSNEKLARAESRKHTLVLLMISPLVTTARYEGLYLIGVIFVLLLLRRKVALALPFLVVSLLPLVIFAMASVAQGGHVVPNSVLVKGIKPDFSTLRGTVDALGLGALKHLKANYYLWPPFLISLWLLCRRMVHRQTWQPSSTVLMIYMAMTLISAQFCRITYFYRYEAYLIVAAIVAISASLADRGPMLFSNRRSLRLALMTAVALVFVLYGSILVHRAFRSFVRTPQACRSIYQQQRQMANFIARYYNGRGVAINDVGAINYYADVKCLDFWGLATNEMADNRSGLTIMTGGDLLELAEKYDVRLAVLYKDEFAYMLPPTWEPAAYWTVPDNAVNFDDTVTFYSVDPDSQAELLDNLRDFERYLPKNVIVEYLQ